MEHVMPELHHDEFQKQMEPLLQASVAALFNSRDIISMYFWGEGA